MPPLSTGFPSGPFVDPSGEITDVWRRYLLTLDARTGGRIGVDAGALIAAETAARVAGDTVLSTAVATEGVRRQDGDTAEASARRANDTVLTQRLDMIGTGFYESTAIEAAARAAADAIEAAARAAADTALGLRIDALGATGIYAPLVTGDVPPQLIGTTDGQAIMVRIV